MQMRPIIPKKDPFANFKNLVDREVAKELRDFGAEGQRKLSTYPPAQTEYRRTGDLGRKWTTEGPKEMNGGLGVRIGNSSDHAVYVQGPPDGGPGERQVPLFKSYGWMNVKDLIDDVWPKYKANLKRLLAKGK